MREKIYALAKGNFTYETPKLVVSPDKLVGEVVSGSQQKFVIRVSNFAHTKIKGFGFAEAEEILFTPAFDGQDNEIECEVDATHIISGETLRGKLSLVTDCGEFKLPYEFHIVAPVLLDEDGTPVRDYFTLQKITQNDAKEGLQLFKDPVFTETFLYRDEDGKLVYNRLLKANSGLSGMEEFLVAYDKKQAVRFVPEHRGVKFTEKNGPIVYELEGSDIEDAIDIRLNTWGSIPIRVSVEGDFIDTYDDILWTDEFASELYHFKYKIVSGRVKAGRHFGRITFISPYEKYEIDYVVHSPVGAKDRKITRAKQAVKAMLVRSFLAFEEKRVTREEFAGFLAKHRQIIERLDMEYAVPLRGYIAWMLDDEAAKLLFYRDTERLGTPHVGSDQQKVENYVLSEYVKYLYSCRKEDLDVLSHTLDTYIGNGYMSTTMLLVRLRSGQPYIASVPKTVEALREQMALGGYSPLLYSELMRMYVEYPETLVELDGLNLRTLLYGLKNDLMTERLAEIINVLSEGRGLPHIERYGMFSDRDSLSFGTGALLMQVLFGLWNKYEQQDTLRNICILLIRHEKRDRQFHIWYERGVNAMLRITDLFEYYIYTSDPESRLPLPPVVLSYFQYENHLGDARKAFLYATIVANRETSPVVYENYEDQIREFVKGQIERERVTPTLGFLYENMMDVGTAMELKTHLPHIIFRYMITCDIPGIESVTCVPMHTSTEKTYPLDRGKALLEIYTKDFRLFFTDRDGNQYVESVDYKLERFFDGDDYALLCYPEPENNGEKEDKNEDENISDNLMKNTDISESLIFYIATEAIRKPRLDDREADALSRALTSGKLRDGFQGKVFLRLFDHIMERLAEEDRDEELRLLMRYVNPLNIKRNRVYEVAAECVRLEIYETAYDILKIYGRGNISDDDLIKLVKHVIDERHGEFDDTLVKWAYRLFKRGSDDHSILNYLLQYFMGETDVLVDIFRRSLPRKSEGSGVDQLSNFEGHIKSDPKFYENIRERVLGQILFAERDPVSTEDIFLQYFEDGENRILVKSYLSKLAYNYIVGKGNISEDTYGKIYHQAVYGKETVMVLAALKSLSTRDSYDEKEVDFIEEMLEEYASQGIVLPFMKEFSSKVIVPYEVRTPVIVQYYSGTDKGVFLFVKNEGKYESMPMRRAFDGIFVASMLLFAGEETKGYIYEEENGKRSKEFDLRKKETFTGGESLFEQVNAMIEAKEADNEEEYEKIRKRYIVDRYVANKLFEIL